MSEDQPPHRNLYTRIKASSKGVGLFAIRGIPKGTQLFVGDVGNTIRILVSTIDKISDAEVRHMYTDFCPVVDKYFIAPSDFNQMTMSWYMNHSNEPNVTVVPDLQFVTSRVIHVGEELTVNYTTFSDNALTYVSMWDTPHSK
jgi:SET domain-containing protein